MMQSAPTIRFDIFMAGDVATAKQTCREYCYGGGLCVHIEPVDYIFAGGSESGFRVGIINYPRFPESEETLHRQATELAQLLLAACSQHSYSIVGPDTTTWFSRRPA